MAQSPDWVTSPGQSPSYPDVTFLTGFGIARLDADRELDESIAHAVAAARRNLVEKVRVTIRSSMVSRTEETGAGIRQEFSSATEAFTALDLEGLSDEHYIDKSAEQVFALATVRRSLLEQTYAQRVERLRRDVRQKVLRAHQAEERGDRTRALREYLDASPPLRQLEEAQAILTTVRGSSTALHAFDVSSAGDQTLGEQVRLALTALLARPLSSIDDAVSYLVYCLSEQTDAGPALVRIENPTFRDTGIGSPFARYLRQRLESQCTSLGRWQVRSTERMGAETAIEDGRVLDLEAFYWDQQGGVKVTALLRDQEKGLLVASAEVLIPARVVKTAGVVLVPDNFTRAMEDERTFTRDEVLTGGLELTVRTNKGGDHPVFVTGERMRVYLRVTMPSWIRFVYHLADGSRALLLDSYYIDGPHTGQEIEVPQEFACDAPYGAEVLQVFASTEPFPKVRTENRDGYDLLAGPLDSFLSATRGRQRGAQGVLQAERRIVLTTMEK
jgi:hypothetical protein